MLDWHYEKRLREDLETWVEKGWVTSQGAAAILTSQQQDDGRSRLPMAFAGIGMVCVALALFAFIAANWGAIPKTVKLAGIVFLIAASHGLAALAFKKGRQGVADLATGFATLVFVGGMALVGQIFHLPSDWAGGAFLICIGGLAAAWLTGSRTSLIVAAVAAISWQIIRADEVQAIFLETLLSISFLIAAFVHPLFYPSRVTRWAALMLLFITYGRWCVETMNFYEEHADHSEDILALLVFVGFGAVASILVVFDAVCDMAVKWSSDRPNRANGYWLMTRSMQDVGIFVLSGLLVILQIVFDEFDVSVGFWSAPSFAVTLPSVLALLLVLVGLLLAFKTSKSAALLAVVGFALATLFVGATIAPHFDLGTLILSAMILGSLVGICGLGNWYNNKFWMVCGYLALTAVALLGQSVFFLIAGVTLLGLALWLARLFRKKRSTQQSAEAST